MSSENKQRGTDKIRFSIGAKLVTIISIIIIISLGSFTALVSWLSRSDLRISAEENNFEINRRSAIEAETLLITARSNSRLLIQTITAGGAASRQTTDFFFTENPKVAAVFYAIQGQTGQILTNKPFFRAAEIDETLVSSYFDGQKEALAQAGKGETLLRNAAPHFSKPILALFFPLQGGGGGAALFSSETVNQNFNSGVNKSLLLNSDGDILVSSDLILLKEGVNVADLEFIRSILDNSDEKRQQFIKADFGVLWQSSSSGKCGFFLKVWEKVKYYFIKVVYKFLDAPLDENDEETKTDESGVNHMLIAFTKLNTAGAVVITAIEYDKIFEGLAAATKRNIYLTISVLCLSIIFISLFSITISIPIRSLAEAAKQVESGVFDPELDHESKDEIGVLTGNFKKMCSALNTFGSFSNREIALKSMNGELRSEGVLKPVSILFSDIREFAAKIESLSGYYGAEASVKIIQWLNRYFTEMVDCVEKTNGVTDKFIGDALMAHWGAVSTAGSLRKDAFNCIKAALMMRKALFFLNKSRKPGDAGNPPIHIGCGINSGIVTAGTIGGATRKEYTVFGEPVNHALHIERLTKTLGVDILISEYTWRLAGDRFICEEMQAAPAEGGKAQRVYAVINFFGELKGPQSLQEVRDILGY